MSDKRRRPSTAPLEEAFGIPFEPSLLERALTHRSYAYENGGLPTNERLEFLGDSVLGVVITSALYHNHPDLPEGQLAKLRASVVNMHALADVARALGPHGLGPHLLLGKGEETTGGRDKASILADTLEALLGAIYLERGLDAAGEVIHRLFDPLMAESAGRGAALDWKTSLQELTAALGLGVPDYVIEDFSRPPVASSPLPSLMCLPRSMVRATSASARALTTAARSLASRPSDRSGLVM